MCIKNWIVAMSGHFVVRLGKGKSRIPFDKKYKKL